MVTRKTFHHGGHRGNSASLLASIGLGAGLRPHRGGVAPTGLGRQSAAYPGLTPGAKLCRPFGTLYLRTLYLRTLGTLHRTLHRTPNLRSLHRMRFGRWHDQRLGTL
jgi:hypothetical protein